MAKSVKPPVETPPYLKQVRIRDYAPLRDAKADFKPGLNIIIGSNGAGKTRFSTLVSSLLELQEEHLIGVGSELLISGRHEVKVVFREQMNLANGENDFLRLDIRSRKPLSIHATYGLETTKELTTILDVAIADLINDPSFFYSIVLIKHGIPVSGLPIVDESGELLLEKRLATVQLKTGQHYLHEIESRFIQAMTRTIVSVVRNGFTVKNGISVPPISPELARGLILKAIDEYVLRLNCYLPLYSPIQSTRCGDFFQVYYQEQSDQYIIKGLVLEFQLQENWLPFAALSDGTKRLFYIIAEMISPKSVSINKETKKTYVTDENKIIFLEEPELDIHPKQLTKLLNLIREVSNDHQVIMTTHSPQVLDMLTEKELDRITICTLDAKKGTQFHKLSRTKQQQAREYMQETGFLSDYWRYSFLEETEAE